VSDQAASSNASKLEREVPAIRARIAYLSRDNEVLIREKRRRLEERLWSWHDGNISDYWETVEVEVRNKKGQVALDTNGQPKTKKVMRMKDLAQLTSEQQQHIESITVNGAGIPSLKLYSASWANSELRKFHALGEDTSNPTKLSDAELVTQLANQAKELGIEIDLSYRPGSND
jgi:hypothetical protein